MLVAARRLDSAIDSVRAARQRDEAGAAGEDQDEDIKGMTSQRSMEDEVARGVKAHQGDAKDVDRDDACARRRRPCQITGLPLRPDRTHDGKPTKEGIRK